MTTTETGVVGREHWQFDPISPRLMRAMCQWDRFDLPRLDIPRMNMLNVLLATAGLPHPTVKHAHDQIYKGYFKLLEIERKSMASLEVFEYGHRN